LAGSKTRTSAVGTGLDGAQNLKLPVVAEVTSQNELGQTFTSQRDSTNSRIGSHHDHTLRERGRLTLDSSVKRKQSNLIWVCTNRSPSLLSDQEGLLPRRVMTNGRIPAGAPRPQNCLVSRIPSGIMRRVQGFVMSSCVSLRMSRHGSKWTAEF